MVHRSDLFAYQLAHLADIYCCIGRKYFVPQMWQLTPGVRKTFGVTRCDIADGPIGFTHHARAVVASARVTGPINAKRRSALGH